MNHINEYIYINSLRNRSYINKLTNKIKQFKNLCLDVKLFAYNCICRSIKGITNNNNKIIVVDIYTFAYNETLMLPYFVEHYRTHFPGCRITVYDNCSTDNTSQLAKDLDCKVIEYESGCKFSEDIQTAIKNKCWKESDAEWVIVCDMDELLDASLNNLKEECSTILRTQGWDMIGGISKEDFNFYSINHGVPNNKESKHIAFKPKKILEMNFDPGGHHCFPKGQVCYSYKVYNLYHYKYLYLDYVISRHKMSANRLSQKNLEMGWGVHYLIEEDEIRSIYIKNKEIMKKLF